MLTSVGEQRIESRAHVVMKCVGVGLPVSQHEGLQREWGGRFAWRRSATPPVCVVTSIVSIVNVSSHDPMHAAKGSARVSSGVDTRVDLGRDFELDQPSLERLGLLQQLGMSGLHVFDGVLASRALQRVHRRGLDRV